MFCAGWSWMLGALLFSLLNVEAIFSSALVGLRAGGKTDFSHDEVWERLMSVHNEVMDSFPEPWLPAFLILFGWLGEIFLPASTPSRLKSAEGDLR